MIDDGKIMVDPGDYDDGWNWRVYLVATDGW